MAPSRKIVLIAGFCLAPLLCGAPAINFFDPAAVRHRATPGNVALTVSADGRRSLRVSAGQAETRVALEPASGAWDLSFYTDISASLRNLSGAPLQVSLRIENAGATEKRNAITGSVQVAAGAASVLSMQLSRPVGHYADGSELILIGMRSFPWATSRKPAQPKIDPRKVTRISLIAVSAKGPVRFELTALEPSGTTVMKTAPGKPVFPMFDEYGQYIHWEWPGKVHSVEDMRRSGEIEAADLERHPRPGDWDEYGGWAAGPALRATGAFRTEKYQGKWWLVDPKGKLFFSYGPACVQLNGDPTILEKRRNYFAWIPEKTDPRYKDFFSSVGVNEDFDFGTGSLESFSFLPVNLLRKFGENWREESAALAHRRVASWAMNTMANWTDLEVCRMDRYYPRHQARTPYTLPVSFRGAPKLGGGPGKTFNDPFHPGFIEALRSGMKEVAEPTANDPWCIGYFVQNEVAWDGRNIFYGALESGAGQPAKQALVRYLKGAYGSTARLNTAWKTKLASWDAVLKQRDFKGAAVPGKDVDGFFLAFMEQYFKTVRGVVKEVAPDRLYLGCRFHSWSRMKIPAIAAARYVDVVSVNHYATPEEMANFTYPNNLDVPVVISEWHFGARDRGQLDCGIRAVANQEERAKAFDGFMRAALAHPLVVGAHWFRYHDHASAGRAGGDSRSNSQNGLLDGTDNPYMETIEAARAIGQAMYGLRGAK